jgi:hypothetical protein
MGVAHDDALQVAHGQIGPLKQGCDVSEGMGLVGYPTPEHDVADSDHLDGVLPGGRRLVVSQVEPRVGQQIGWTVSGRAH